MTKLNWFKIKNLFGVILLSLFAFVLMACGQKVEKIELSETNLLLGINEEVLVNATITPSDLDVKVDWSSSDKLVATVSSDGLIKALKVGQATITAKVGKVTAKVTVKVEDIKYNVIFNTDGGTIIPVQTVNRGGKVTKPDNPTKDGFEFLGWYTASNLAVEFNFDTPITSNTTIYASWNNISVFVNFNTNGGEEIDPLQKNHGSELTETDIAVIPIKEGHTFTGWYLDSEFEDLVESGLVLINSITIYANWEVNDYVVSFELDNNETIPSVTLSYGSIIEVEDPVKEGYEFAGWYTDEERLTVFDIMVDTVYGQMTLYAKWNIGKSTVIFNTNGGSKIYNVLVDTFEPVEKPVNPTRANMVFVGWYSDSGLTQEFDFDTPILGTTELYAAWELDPAVGKKVEFELNGGSFPISGNDFFIKYGVTPIVSMKAFIFEGNPWDTTTQTYLHVQKKAETGNYWAKACLKVNELGQFEVVDFAASGSVKMNNYDYVISAWDQSGAPYQFVMNLQIGQILTVTGVELTDDVEIRTVFEQGVVNVYNSVSAYNEKNANLIISSSNLPTPIKDGYKFIGWFDNEGLTGAKVTRISETVKLYAKWEAE